MQSHVTAAHKTCQGKAGQQGGEEGCNDEGQTVGDGRGGGLRECEGELLCLLAHHANMPTMKRLVCLVDNWSISIFKLFFYLTMKKQSRRKSACEVPSV